jgi:uncharacterized membrane protein
MAKDPAETGPTRPAIVGAFVARPRLVGSILAGLAAGAAIAYFTELRAVTAVAMGWDVMCLVFWCLMTLYMANRDALEMRTHAAEADEGAAVVLMLILLASVVSVAATVLELSAAKNDRGLARALYVALAFFTVAMSWFFVQLNFALHYAHAYYTRADGRPGDAGGLAFPGTKTPDYWDFVHFSIVIGVASQTADVAFTDKSLRRLGTTHSLFAFAFNTVIVALTINLLASLF